MNTNEKEKYERLVRLVDLIEQSLEAWQYAKYPISDVVEKIPRLRAYIKLERDLMSKVEQ